MTMTEDQLQLTTKRTIMENEQMASELQYQGKETERLLHRNQKLARENAALRRDIEVRAHGSTHVWTGMQLTRAAGS